MNTTANADAKRAQIDGAIELASIMHNFFETNKRYQATTFGIIGYATEFMLKYFAIKGGIDQDKMSLEYREYLKVVHDDLKRMNTNAN